MTPEDVTERVLAISKMRDDYERAHSAEDDLRRDVLQAIALGNTTDPAGCARAAVASAYIKFPRHTA
jgi:hypothetical protein